MIYKCKDKGLGVWQKHMALSELGIYACSKERNKPASSLCMACEQPKQSDFETGYVFSVVITGDFNLGIYKVHCRPRVWLFGVLD